VQSKQLKATHAVLTELIQGTEQKVYESESDDEICVDAGADANEKPNMLLGYVCVLCLQLKFKTKALVEWQSQSPLPSNTRSIDGKMYCCVACLNSQNVFVQCRKEYEKSLQRCVPNMNRLEERLIALRCPYVWLMQLPKGGEFSVKGSIINVPCNITTTMACLPRSIAQNHTCVVRWKRKLTLKNDVLCGLVRPTVLLDALRVLQKTPLYVKEGYADTVSCDVDAVEIRKRITRGGEDQVNWIASYVA